MSKNNPTNIKPTNIKSTNINPTNNNPTNNTYPVIQFHILNQVDEKEEMSFYDILIKSLDEYKADIVKLEQEYNRLLDTITYDTTKLDQFITEEYRKGFINRFVNFGETKKDQEKYKRFCDTSKLRPLSMGEKFYLLKRFKLASKKKRFLDLDLSSLQDIIYQKAWSDAEEHFDYVFKK